MYTVIVNCLLKKIFFVFRMIRAGVPKISESALFWSIECSVSSVYSDVCVCPQRAVYIKILGIWQRRAAVSVSRPRPLAGGVGLSRSRSAAALTSQKGNRGLALPRMRGIPRPVRQAALMP